MPISSSKREYRLLQKQLRALEKEETKLLAYKPTEDDSGVFEKIRRKIPEKALNAIETAFTKGFSYLLKKGDPILEKTGGLEKTRSRSEKYHESLERAVHPKTLKAVDKAADSKNFSMKAGTTIEGSVMGIFGIGLPDIPIFLGMMLKAVYEVAAGYGFDYREPAERKYVMAVIKVAFTHGGNRILYSQDCDRLGEEIDGGAEIDTEISESDIEKISGILTSELLVWKFIQGRAIVGAVGGPLNRSMLKRATDVARIKYKKRFLRSLLKKY